MTTFYFSPSVGFYHAEKHAGIFLAFGSIDELEDYILDMEDSDEIETALDDDEIETLKNYGYFFN